VIIGRGAEAVVELKEGVVVKRRIKKNYRHPKIDQKLRFERNRKESRLMQKVTNIRVPKVISSKEFEFSMEEIKGKRLKERGVKDLSRKIGEVVGELHSQGIYHGDLTTSNMILSGGEVVLIDFGLSDRGKIEDFATDLKVLFETMNATHDSFLKPEFFKGYDSKMSKNKEVKNRLKVVYSRGRYLKPNR